MPFDLWLAFTLASAMLLAIPGPTALLVVSYALGYGRGPVAAVIAGVALGDLTAMTASMLGLGAVLAASPTVFTVLRWIGGAYLIWLGIRMWRVPVQALGSTEAPNMRPGRMFAHAFAVTALSPSGIVFFVAFVPQFMVANRPLLPQMAVLVATFVGLGAASALLYALVAVCAHQRLQVPRLRRAANRTGGSLLVGAGLLAVGWHRANA